jgi:hypothetical protein
VCHLVQPVTKDLEAYIITIQKIFLGLIPYLDYGVSQLLWHPTLFEQFSKKLNFARSISARPCVEVYKDFGRQAVFIFICVIV